ncbi:pterin binding enzyme [Methanobrevibacter cuticularis]|uniref:Pterin binding enzyme n=1 Tax=Methanobrevibacter cuticularis TaxID=47311 RepID=A0A166DD56_9EURY|nr:dihydropteroate synthase-like protein [Methanobrevibacter cuticularis]KZX15464.1 pterin binding enzyme [Methanobrevibacter cuticularis]
MKILIITGKLAYPLVKKLTNESNEDVIIHVADTQIAAFLTPNKVIKDVKKYYSDVLKDIDMILVPGLMKKDSTEIAKALNIPTFKGSADAADLSMVLNLIEELELSETKTADKLIEDEKRKKAFEFIENFENDSEKVLKLLKKPNNILIKDLAVGEDFPMRILGEIANAPSLSKEELIWKAQYFIDNGVDMIDIGMIAGEDMSSEIPNIISTLRSVIGNRPLSIDTLNTKEIKIAVENDIDLVLSLDLGNYKEVLPILKEKNIPAVLLPTNFSESFIPHTPKERVLAMNKLVNACEGIDTIADMVLDPINSSSIVDSIIACREFRKTQDIPMFFGVGNVTELLDTDSTGANALLGGIAMELKTSVLFTPDESGKTWNSVNELAISSKMMFLAKHRDSIPKDLGLNLLIFKDKKKRQFEQIQEIQQINESDEEISENLDIQTYNAEKELRFILDPKGSFKIKVEHGTRYDKSKIVVTHFKKAKPDLAIQGQDARKIYNELVERGLVTRLEHAAYLGAELQKAEIAMITTKEYVQDFELFKKPLILNNK